MTRESNFKKKGVAVQRFAVVLVVSLATLGFSTVPVAAAGGRRKDVEFGDPPVDDLVRELKDYRPTLTYCRDSLEVSLGVDAVDACSAARIAEEAMSDAFTKIGWSSAGLTVRQVVEESYIHEQLALHGVQALIGLNEIAECLGVSQQRASQLTKRPEFPPCLGTVANKAVWNRNDVEDFKLSTWNRKPGRPAALSKSGS